MLKPSVLQVMLTFAVLAVLFPTIAWADAPEDGSNSFLLTTTETSEEAPYLRQLAVWQKQAQEPVDFDQTIAFEALQGTQVTEVKGQMVHQLSEDETLSFVVTVPKTALYQISFDVYVPPSEVRDPVFALQVDGTYPFLESRRLTVPMLWENETNTFVTNASGRQLIPPQQPVSQWTHTTLHAAEALVADGFLLLLEEGTHTLDFVGVSGTWSIDQITVHTPKQMEDYQTYKTNHSDLGNLEAQTKDATDHDRLVTVEAEHTLHRSQSSIRPFHAPSTSVEPYSNDEVLLNAFGGSSWGQSGQRVTWAFQVPVTGMYQITLKLNQSDKKNTPVFRNILLNGEIPFAELLMYRLEPTSNWENHTLGNEEEAFAFYLTEGSHTITMEATAAPLAEPIHQLEELMTQMSDLGLAIKKLTGNQIDTNRDWALADYLPDIEDRFTLWETALEGLHQQVAEAYDEHGKNAQELVQLTLVKQKITQLGGQINALPNRLADLSEGSNSAVQTLALIQTLLQDQPVALDRFYVHGETAEIPQARVGFITDAQRKFTTFLRSFNTQPIEEADDSIEVWVARSQQYVELMQQMAESTFTEETGITVNFSVMPNEQKLILANASGQQPDVALGISVGTPYELAIRGAAQDLTAFDDFKDISRSFSPGAFLPMMIDDGIYALPETQDFYVQFTRTDIFNHLNLEIPDTWADVTGLLPELQRVGMNYFVPLSGSAGTKPFMFTAPFIYQFGGALYSDDGTSTAIDQEPALAGLQFMSELYTLYSLPQQVPNFYHSFRYGELPIGLSNFETYVKLTAAAPEIANAWDISLYPGVVEADGTVNRWATGSAQSAMMFDQSAQKEDAWSFMKWWLEADTQVNFAQNLLTVYGAEYMWNTANLEAFAQLPWPEAHKEVILAQWAYLKEVPKTPGAYILEREISNVWTDVVFNGVHLRASVDDRVITINREIRRKLAEFGYMEGNRLIRPYHIPTLERMEAWFNEE